MITKLKRLPILIEYKSYFFLYLPFLHSKTEFCNDLTNVGYQVYFLILECLTVSLSSVKYKISKCERNSSFYLENHHVKEYYKIKYNIIRYDVGYKLLANGKDSD